MRLERRFSHQVCGMEADVRGDEQKRYKINPRQSQSSEKLVVVATRVCGPRSLAESCGQRRTENSNVRYTRLKRIIDTLSKL